MIKIVTKKQWNELKSTVDIQRKTIARMNSDMYSMKWDAEKEIDYLRRRTAHLEREVRELKKKNRLNERKK